MIIHNTAAHHSPPLSAADVNAVAKFDDLLLAVEYVSAGGSMGDEAYLCRATGAIHYHTEPGDNEESLPDDVADADKYVAIPQKSDLGLGKGLVQKFAAKVLPEDAKEIDDFFRRRGAYGRFKNLLERRGVLQQWFDFEAAALSDALREWCADNEIEVSEEELVKTSGEPSGHRTLAGKCLCGAVEYAVRDEFTYALNCHCSNCRRATGAAFKSFAGIERSKLRITKGGKNLLIFGEENANDARCKVCGSLLYSVVRDGAFVHVTLGTLVDAPAIRPTAHIFVGSKAPWFEITDDLPQHEERG